MASENNNSANSLTIVIPVLNEEKTVAVTVEKVLAHPSMRGVLNAVPTEVHGEQFVDGISYSDTHTNKAHKLDVKGIFVEIGQIPNASFAMGVVELNQGGQIVADPYTQRTSTLGIWAAGDVTDVRFHQNNISAGDAVKALEDIYNKIQVV